MSFWRSKVQSCYYIFKSKQLWWKKVETFCIKLRKCFSFRYSRMQGCQNCFHQSLFYVLHRWKKFANTKVVAIKVNSILVTTTQLYGTFISGSLSCFYAETSDSLYSHLTTPHPLLYVLINKLHPSTSKIAKKLACCSLPSFCVISRCS